MKIKKITKTLSLNKETVSNLDLTTVKGGHYEESVQIEDVTFCRGCSDYGTCLSCHCIVGGGMSAYPTQCILMDE